MVGLDEIPLFYGVYRNQVHMAVLASQKPRQFRCFIQIIVYPFYQTVLKSKPPAGLFKIIMAGSKDLR